MYGHGTGNYKRVVIHTVSLRRRIKGGYPVVDLPYVTDVDNEGALPRRARIAQVLAVTGTLLAIGGFLLGVLFAILARAWSGEIACDGVQSWILGLLPAASAAALASGLLLGIGSMTLHPTQRRVAASAISLSIVGFVVAFIAIALNAWTACSNG